MLSSRRAAHGRRPPQGSAAPPDLPHPPSAPIPHLPLHSARAGGDVPIAGAALLSSSSSIPACAALGLAPSSRTRWDPRSPSPAALRYRRRPLPYPLLLTGLPRVSALAGGPGAAAPWAQRCGSAELAEHGRRAARRLSPAPGAAPLYRAPRPPRPTGRPRPRRAPEPPPARPGGGHPWAAGNKERRSKGGGAGCFGRLCVARSRREGCRGGGLSWRRVRSEAAGVSPAPVIMQRRGARPSVVLFSPEACRTTNSLQKTKQREPGCGGSPLLLPMSSSLANSCCSSPGLQGSSICASFHVSPAPGPAGARRH